MKRLFILIFLFIMIQAWACVVPTATTTIYFTPDAKKICGRYYSKDETPCSQFKTQVKMQGSGTLSPGWLYPYKGLAQKKPVGCPTTVGYAGTCLIPFISVAADPRFHHMGDIISMPALKGKIIKLKDGQTIKHPGFFIVHDTGGAIKGRARFDFYTGQLAPADIANPFGYKGLNEVTMASEEDCSTRKKIIKLLPKDFSKPLKEISKVTSALLLSEGLVISTGQIKKNNSVDQRGQN